VQAVISLGSAGTAPAGGAAPKTPRRPSRLRLTCRCRGRESPGRATSPDRGCFARRK
jgi:hypothetical protein